MTHRIAGSVVFASFALAAAALAQPQSATPDHYTLLRCGHLLASAAKEPLANVTLVIKNDRVDSVLAGFDGPDLAGERKSGATVTEVDLKRSFVLPGLIDCHVHLSAVWDQTVRQRFVFETPEFVAVRATMYARQTLEAGFTTVRDLGAPFPASIFALRDSINAGYVIGPRIIAAGHPISI